MARLLDISPPVHPGIGVWPDDVPYRREVSLSFAFGDHLELSSVQSTLHLGAHADAPIHYVAGGAGIAARPLDRYLGPCEVVAVDGVRGRRLLPADLPGPVRAPRVLLRTGSFPDPDAWNEDFASLSPELVHHLADQGVVLVGIDTPSVDPQDSKDLPSHGALAARDLAVLEGLVLRDVTPGVYTLLALPLRLVDADASPVRAVLVDDGGAAFAAR
ncbi:MAG: cyclase family protein [Alphaproteobacteria bacterium]|nr:cyclase family protein [Alphaproteobacteria bacterium]